MVDFAKIGTHSRLVVLTLLILVVVPLPAYAWQYGADMSPTTTFYDAYEMPTQGMWNWNTISSGNSFSFWGSASNTGSGGGFSQNGFLANNGGGGLCVSQDPPPGRSQVCLAAHSWGMFYEYCFVCRGVNQKYWGNSIWQTPPAGWKPTDSIYFSGATYANKGEYSWFFYDANNGQTYSTWVCTTQVNGRFTNTVIGHFEGTPTTGYGTAFVDHIALWAEVQQSGQRNYGSAIQTGEPSAPSTILVYKYSGDNNLQIGFSLGNHFPGATLWTGSGSASNENFPYDQCA